MPIDRQSVRSSSLVSVGYSQGTRTLEVEFRGNRVYRYSAVPQTVYDGLMQASSIGSYFHEHIRDRYEYDRVR